MHRHTHQHLTPRQHPQAQYAFQPLHLVIEEQVQDQDQDVNPPSHPTSQKSESSILVQEITLTDPIPEVGASPSQDVPTIIEAPPLETTAVGADTTAVVSDSPSVLGAGAVVTMTTVIETVVPVLTLPPSRTATFHQTEPSEASPFVLSVSSLSDSGSSPTVNSVTVPTELLSLLSSSTLAPNSISSTTRSIPTIPLSSSSPVFNNSSSPSSASASSASSTSHTASFYLGLVLGVITFIACVIAFVSWFMGIRRDHKKSPLRALDVPWARTPDPKHREFKEDEDEDSTRISGTKERFSASSTLVSGSRDSHGLVIDEHVHKTKRQSGHGLNISTMGVDNIHWEPRGDRDAGEPKRTRSYIENACSPVKRRSLPILTVPSPPPPPPPHRATIEYMPNSSFPSSSGPLGGGGNLNYMAGTTPYHVEPLSSSQSYTHPSLFPHTSSQSYSHLHPSSHPSQVLGYFDCKPVSGSDSYRDPQPISSLAPQFPTSRYDDDDDDGPGQQQPPSEGERERTDEPEPPMIPTLRDSLAYPLPCSTSLPPVSLLQPQTRWIRQGFRRGSGVFGRPLPPIPASGSSSSPLDIRREQIYRDGESQGIQQIGGGSGGSGDGRSSLPASHTYAGIGSGSGSGWFPDLEKGLEDERIRSGRESSSSSESFDEKKVQEREEEKEEQPRHGHDQPRTSLLPESQSWTSDLVKAAFGWGVSVPESDSEKGKDNDRLTRLPVRASRRRQQGQGLGDLGFGSGVGMGYPSEPPVDANLDQLSKEGSGRRGGRGRASTYSGYW
ncbi:hypothetical protein K435DRAFT_870576 [Dendrothele bispora CBS 962.96]|uniref:Uncharacterized protein n=1 Tax=Dendrothele bispora (strain CBS 962.96) TaxID=1314807 RepID=A0A4S8L6A0_DENBC|nr:hypothetical protein K435DRAFT_870576 [Dendrothele bispora CBS 962.96]